MVVTLYDILKLDKNVKITSKNCSGIYKDFEKYAEFIICPNILESIIFQDFDRIILNYRGRYDYPHTRYYDLILRDVKYDKRKNKDELLSQVFESLFIQNPRLINNVTRFLIPNIPTKLSIDLDKIKLLLELKNESK